jgi:OOP family OmpA-OmpF porin
MQRPTGTFLGLAAGILTFAAQAEAAPYQDIVTDRHGKPVKDYQGDCVYTNWQQSSPTACDRPLPPAAVPMAAPIPAPPIPPVARQYMDRTTVHFEFDQARLTPYGQQALQRFAIANQGSDIRRLEVRGHADRIGTVPYNERLSSRRAQTVAGYLGTQGIRPHEVATSAYGERYPVANCRALRGEQLIRCLEADRRVEVIVTGYRVSYRAIIVVD